MKYGTNTESVEEIINFVERGDFFVSSIDPEQHDLTIINDYDKAKILAYEQTYGKEEYLWTDIREKEIGIVKGEMYNIKNYKNIREELYKLNNIFFRNIKKKLSKKYDDILDDVSADLYNCCINRTVFAEQNNFFGKIFNIYKSGGWPCGWDGDYPEGRIIAYFPNT